MKYIAILIGIIILGACTTYPRTTKMTEVDAFLRSLVERNKTPSLQYYFFDKDAVIHHFQAGLVEIKGNKEVTEHSKYAGFSTTKTFTALAILQLAEKKLLDIDTLVINYLSTFPYSGNITIRQLLAHTAGIPNPNPLSWIHLEEEHQSFDRNKFFKYEVFNKYNKTKSGPNEKFAYSNLGYVFLGQIIEVVSGKRYEEYIVENIIEPLGLETCELGFELLNGSNQNQGSKTHLAKRYQKRFTAINLLLGFFMDKSKYMGKPEGKWKPFEPSYVNGTSYGGLIGRPDAFVKYVQELLKPDCKLIGTDFKKMLFQENFTNDHKNTGMCLSWRKGKLMGETYYYHPGGGGGFYCEIRVYPEAGLGSVIMFNRSGIKDERFLDKVDKYLII